MDLLRAYSPPLDLPPWWPYIFAARTWNTEKERGRRGRRGEAFGLIRISRGYLKVGQNRIYSRHCDTFSPIRSSLFLFFFLFFSLPLIHSPLPFPFVSSSSAKDTHNRSCRSARATQDQHHTDPNLRGTNRASSISTSFVPSFLPYLRVRRRLISRV